MRYIARFPRLAYSSNRCSPTANRVDICTAVIQVGIVLSRLDPMHRPYRTSDRRANFV